MYSPRNTIITCRLHTFTTQILDFLAHVNFLIFCWILLCYILLQTIDYFDLVKCEVKGQEFKKCGS